MKPYMSMAHGLRSPWSWRAGLLLLCTPYLQGGLQKCVDFPGALSEMAHFGLVPAPFFAFSVIALELGGSAMILTGWFRWLAALALAGFTLLATLLANRFWLLQGAERFGATNAFFEHLALAGALVLVAWWDRRRQETPDA
jgi:uncharacterized membrane protein YphA (DoxX/SURF4 family)